jgi:hypothetical protein
MEAQAKKLVAYLKRRSKIASYYDGSKSDWDYYYSISGWFKGKYFCIYLFKGKDSEPENHIGSTTDCVEEIRNLFNKYSLDETREYFV